MSSLTVELTDALALDLASVPGVVLSDEDWQRPGYSPKQVACKLLLKNIVKKYNDAEMPTQNAVQAAIDKLVLVNERSRKWEFKPECMLDEYLFGQFRLNFQKFMDRVCLDEWGSLVSDGRLGPGSNVGCQGNDLYTKLFNSPLTYTDSLLPYVFNRVVSTDHRWFSALSSPVSGPVHVQGSKIVCVNKNVDIARAIAVEPTLNMWFQLAIGSRIERALRSVFNIDIRTQADVNKELARFGSSVDGTFCTIDLESASDTLSLALMSDILGNKRSFFMKTRSSSGVLPSGDLIEFGMLSSMGNGYTFPLQTAVFACVVQTAYQFAGVKLDRGGMRNFGVFGDDIIVVDEANAFCLRLLKLIGCQPNVNKTFSRGPFRESCGGDFYAGVYVRPVYVKKLKTQEDYYVAINSLISWSASHDVNLRRTIGLLISGLRKLLRGRLPLYVPPDENLDSGLHVPLTMARAVPDKHGSVAYSARRAVSDGLVYKLGSLWCGKRRVRLNLQGLVLTFLSGGMSGSLVPRRQRVVRYRTQTEGLVTPNWGIFGARHRDFSYDAPRWSTAVVGYLIR